MKKLTHVTDEVDTLKKKKKKKKKTLKIEGKLSNFDKISEKWAYLQYHSCLFIMYIKMTQILRLRCA